MDRRDEDALRFSLTLGEIAGHGMNKSEMTFKFGSDIFLLAVIIILLHQGVVPNWLIYTCLIISALSIAITLAFTIYNILKHQLCSSKRSKGC